MTVHMQHSMLSDAQSGPWLRFLALLRWMLLFAASGATPVVGALVSAVLPVSRAVEVGVPATAFATIINAGSQTATGCGITLATPVSGTFTYQTTDPSTNAVTGVPDTPTDIAAGASQSFVVSLTPDRELAPTEIAFDFDCDSTEPAALAPGVNTLLVSVSGDAGPDIVALAATAPAPGIVDVPGVGETGAFAVATFNVGAPGRMTVSTDTGDAAVAADVVLCPSDPTTGACLADPAASVTLDIASGETPTFSVFPQARLGIPFDPAANRVYVRFRDAEGLVRGSTSVAIRTVVVRSPELALDRSNAAAVAERGLSAPGFLYEIISETLARMVDLEDDRETTIAGFCRFGGSQNVSVIDRDANGVPSSGDVVLFLYEDCSNLSYSYPVSGGLAVAFTHLVFARNGQLYAQAEIAVLEPLRFTVDPDDPFVPNDPVVNLLLDGGLRFTYLGDDDGDVMTVAAAAGSTLSIEVQHSINGTTRDELRDIAMTRSSSDDDGVQLDFAVSVDSGLLGGAFDCRTATALRVPAGNAIQAGRVVCNGDGGSVARVDTLANDAVTTRVDEDGSGALLPAVLPQSWSGTWTDYLPFNIRQQRIDTGSSFIPPPSYPAIATTDLSVGADRMIYSATDDMLYGVDADGLVVVNPDSGQVTRVSLPDVPSALAAASDGSTLWVGFQDAGAIQPIDVATLTPGARVDLGVEPQYGQRFGEALAVAPGGESVIVAMRGGREVIAFAGGQALPDSVVGFTGPTQIAFGADGRLVGIDHGTSDRALSIYSTGSTGVVLDTTLRRMFRTTGGDMTLVGDRVVVASGHVLTPAIETIEGQYDVDLFGVSSTQVLVNEAAGHVYFVPFSGGQISVFDEMSFRALGRFELGASGTPVDLLDAGERVAVVRRDGLQLIDKAALTPGASPACERLDLSGLLVAGTHVQIDCGFNHGVYDAARDLVYASLPGALRRDGNAIAFITARDARIVDVVPVASDPSRLQISDDGQSLVVVFETASRYQVLDLQTRSVSQSVPLGRTLDSLEEPLFGFSAASVPAPGAGVVVSFTDRQGAASFVSGVRSDDVVTDTDVGHVAFAGAADTAYGYFFGALTRLMVGSNGVAVAGVDQVANDARVVRKGRLLYGSSGAVIDPALPGVIDQCALPEANIQTVAPDPRAPVVYFYGTAFEGRVYRCEESDFSVGAGVPVANFDGSAGGTHTLIKTRLDHLMLVGSEKLILIDAP